MSRNKVQNRKRRFSFRKLKVSNYLIYVDTEDANEKLYSRDISKFWENQLTKHIEDSKYISFALYSIKFHKVIKISKINPNIILKLLYRNNSLHLSIEKLRELYFTEDSNISFSVETLRIYGKKYLGFTYRREYTKHLRTLYDRNEIIMKIFIKKIFEIINEENVLF